MFDKLFDFLNNLISPVTELIDKSQFGEEERLELKKAVYELQTKTQLKMAELQIEAAKIDSELQKELNKNGSFLTRNWRPFLMVCFGLIVVSQVIMGWFGYPLTVPAWIGETIKYSMGIYIGGRSIEKNGIISQIFGGKK